MRLMCNSLMLVDYIYVTIVDFQYMLSKSCNNLFVEAFSFQYELLSPFCFLHNL